MSGTIKGGEGGDVLADREVPLSLPLNAAIFDCMLALEKFRSRLSTLTLIISNAELENAIQELEATKKLQAQRQLDRQPDVHGHQRDPGSISVHDDADRGHQRSPGVSPVNKQPKPRGARG